MNTPYYVFDIKKLYERIEFIRRNLRKNIKLCYAMKANAFLVKELIDLFDYFEVCSPGEYQICKQLKVPANKIVLSGVYKEANDIKGIINDCKEKPIYTIESLAQLDLLDSLAKENNLILNVYLRLSSGNQFGMGKESIEYIVKAKEKFNINILGIQSYTGTQKKIETIQKELTLIKEFYKELEDKNDCIFERFEYGPGLRVRYFKNEPDIDEEKMLNELNEALNMFEDKEVVLEMGRFIVAYCGQYHTKVVDIKNNDKINYCIVDGGINHLNYYGQTMAMKAPFIEEKDKIITDNSVSENWTICGSLCTTADVLIRNYPLHDLKIGDELIFYNVGAYSITEGIYLFLSRNMPAVYKKTIDEKLVLLRDVISTYKMNF